MSILLTITDKDTKTNVSRTMTTETAFPLPRDKVRTYSTLMGGNPSQKGPAPMDIDQIGEKTGAKKAGQKMRLGETTSVAKRATRTKVVCMPSREKEKGQPAVASTAEAVATKETAQNVLG